jgi:cephalosporin-C deacetylase
MGLFDLSLEKLKEYSGINPKPEDFDEFWDRSLSELWRIDPCVEIVPAGIKCSFADCYSLYFTGVADSRIHSKLIIPKGLKSPTGAVLKFHGYSGNSGAWIDGFQFTAAGLVYAAMDCRGQRGYSQDRGTVSGDTFHGMFIRGIDDDPQKMTMRNTFLDTAMLARVIMEMAEVDEKRIGVLGGSQGGALATVCAALVPEIKKAAIMYPFLSDYKRVWEMDLATGAYEELKTYFRTYDPKHQREDEIFRKLGYIDIQNLAPWIKGEVLFFTGLMDTICPPSTQFAVYNKISSKKNMNIYPDFGHEMIAGAFDEAFEFLMDI